MLIMTSHDFAVPLILHFKGPYTKTSPQYLLPCLYAAQPLTYEKHLLQFQAYRIPFFIGGPATVMIEGLSSKGIFSHVLYGMVCSIKEEVDHYDWPLVESLILVKVHSIPDYDVDWELVMRSTSNHMDSAKATTAPSSCFLLMMKMM
jgi:hypothetical protein